MPAASDTGTADAPEENTTEPFVHVGDRLGGMTVVSVAPFNTGQYSQVAEFTRLSPENVTVLLSGPIKVQGTYQYVDLEIGFQGYCMFDFDAASLALLPALPGSTPTPRFCFRNATIAERELGKTKRPVTVLIDHYELNAYPTEVTDFADLIEVESKGR